MQKPYTVEYDEFDTRLHYVVKRHWWKDKIISAHRSHEAAVNKIEQLVNGRSVEAGAKAIANAGAPGDMDRAISVFERFTRSTTDKGGPK